MTRFTERDRFGAYRARRSIIHLLDIKIKNMSNKNVIKKYLIMERNNIAKKCGSVLLKMPKNKYNIVVSYNIKVREIDKNAEKVLRKSMRANKEMLERVR